MRSWEVVQQSLGSVLVSGVLELCNAKEKSDIRQLSTARAEIQPGASLDNYNSLHDMPRAHGD